eukprot:7803921-Lingulodinium_polyedra.AAC.2
MAMLRAVVRSSGVAPGRHEPGGLWLWPLVHSPVCLPAARPSTPALWVSQGLACGAVDPGHVSCTLHHADL